MAYLLSTSSAIVLLRTTLTRASGMHMGLSPSSLFYPSGSTANECREGRLNVCPLRGLSLSLREVEPLFLLKRGLFGDGSAVLIACTHASRWMVCITRRTPSSSLSRWTGGLSRASRRPSVCLRTGRRRRERHVCSARHVCAAWCLFTALPGGRRPGLNHSCTLV